MALGLRPDCADGDGANGDGMCVPYVQPGGTDGTGTPDPDTDDPTDPDTDDPTDSADPGVLSLTWGDPILSRGGDTTRGKIEWEFLDVVALGDGQALAAGQGGFAIVDMGDGTHLLSEDFERIYDLAWDPGLEQAYLGTRLSGVYPLDLQDRDAPELGPRLQLWAGVQEDLAAAQGLLMVAAPETGAVLIEGKTQQVLSIIAWLDRPGRRHAARPVGQGRGVPWLLRPERVRQQFLSVPAARRRGRARRHHVPVQGQPARRSARRHPGRGRRSPRARSAAS